MIFVSPQIPQQNQLQSDKSVKKLQIAQVILIHQYKNISYILFGQAGLADTFFFLLQMFLFKHLF